MDAMLKFLLYITAFLLFKKLDLYSPALSLIVVVPVRMHGLEIELRARRSRCRRLGARSASSDRSRTTRAHPQLRHHVVMCVCMCEREKERNTFRGFLDRKIKKVALQHYGILS